MIKQITAAVLMTLGLAATAQAEEITFRPVVLNGGIIQVLPVTVHNGRYCQFEYYHRGNHGTVLIRGACEELTWQQAIDAGSIRIEGIPEEHRYRFVSDGLPLNPANFPVISPTSYSPPLFTAAGDEVLSGSNGINYFFEVDGVRTTPPHADRDSLRLRATPPNRGWASGYFSANGGIRMDQVERPPRETDEERLGRLANEVLNVFENGYVDPARSRVIEGTLIREIEEGAPNQERRRFLAGAARGYRLLNECLHMYPTEERKRDIRRILNSNDPRYGNVHELPGTFTQIFRACKPEVLLDGTPVTSATSHGFSAQGAQACILRNVDRATSLSIEGGTCNTLTWEDVEAQGHTINGPDDYTQRIGQHF